MKALLSDIVECPHCGAQRGTDKACLKGRNDLHEWDNPSRLYDDVIEMEALRRIPMPAGAERMKRREEWIKGAKWARDYLS